MNGFVGFILLVVFVAVAGVAGWVIYTQFRARKLGLPRPTLSSYNPFKRSENLGAPGPARGGVVGWVNDKYRAFRNRNNRTAGGAYEEPSRKSTRERAPDRGLDDGDWDARVEAEGDIFYEQELDLRGTSRGQGLGLTRTGGGTDLGANRGRSLSQDPPEPYIGVSRAGLNRRYDESVPAVNPFGDGAELSNSSLRGVSPRPVENSKDGRGDSPEKRSTFREDV